MTQAIENKRDGAPKEIRTPDPQIRSLVLYPAELRARQVVAIGMARRVRYRLQPGSASELLRQCHHTATPIASIMAKITTTISAEFSIQAMAGTANAMAKPRLHTCQ